MTKSLTTTVVAHQNGVTLTERIDAMRVESEGRLVAAVLQARSSVDERLVELIRHRALQAVDAVLLAS